MVEHRLVCVRSHPAPLAPVVDAIHESPRVTEVEGEHADGCEERHGEREEEAAAAVCA